ncbi:MAG: DUF5011 domain-containing protein [Candidatus Izimaplasma sp.]|nr:DUF5011 domain-containing protein [Candidatus Izimaplasma bacterium]
MNKIKILFLIIIISFILISCTATLDNISFKLNPGNDTVELNSEYDDPGATAKVFGLKYNYDIIENTVDTSKIGIYYIHYEFNHKEFTLTLMRIVTVVDETPPEIELNPGVDTIYLGQEWIDSYVSVTDNSQEEIDIEVIGEVNNLVVGEYTISYIATDGYGNETEISRIVNVVG